MGLTRIGLVALALAGAVGYSLDLTATRAETARAVFVSATDAKGAPVTDLTAADLAVKEGGQERAIKALSLASAPLEIAMLVDDAGTGLFQTGTLQVIQAFGDTALYSIRRFTPQSVKILDYTNDVAPIQAALNLIGGRGKIPGDGEQLLDAMSDTIKELQKRAAARRVMIVMTAQGEGQPKNPTVVRDELAGSGVIMHVVHTSGAAVGLLTGDGPRQSGGRIEQVGAASGVPAALTKILDTVKHQYLLVYVLPDGVKPAERVSVSTTRKGVTLLAPQRIAVK